MSKLERLITKENVLGITLPLSLLAISLLGVSFIPSKKEYDFEEDVDFDQLGKLERRIAIKLRSLGIDFLFEPLHIVLDKPVKVAGTDQLTGKSKTKTTTTPDFYFYIDGREYFIEIGKKRVNTSKRGQFRVMKRAIELKRKRKMFYAQLLEIDVNEVENIETQGELLGYLYEHRTAIYTK